VAGRRALRSTTTTATATTATATAFPVVDEEMDVEVELEEEEGTFEMDLDEGAAAAAAPAAAPEGPRRGSTGGRGRGRGRAVDGDDDDDFPGLRPRFVAGEVEDEVCCTVGDCTLRRSDAELLRSPNWVNDRIIHYWFQVLEEQRPLCAPIARGAGRGKAAQRVVLVDPSVSYLVTMSKDATLLTSILETMELARCAVALFPINDNRDVGSHEGGTHWSLLVFDRRNHTFSHYDSLAGGSSARGANFASAEQLAERIMAHAGIPSPADNGGGGGGGGAAGLPGTSPLGGAGVFMPGSSPAERWGSRVGSVEGGALEAEALGTRGVRRSTRLLGIGHVSERETPQQLNAYDCGMYVLAIAEAICEAVEEGGAQADHDATVKVRCTPERVTQLRWDVSADVVQRSKHFLAARGH